MSILTADLPCSLKLRLQGRSAVNMLQIRPAIGQAASQLQWTSASLAVFRVFVYLYVTVYSFLNNKLIDWLITNVMDCTSGDLVVQRIGVELAIKRHKTKARHALPLCTRCKHGYGPWSRYTVPLQAELYTSRPKVKRRCGLLPNYVENPLLAARGRR